MYTYERRQYFYCYIFFPFQNKTENCKSEEEESIEVKKEENTSSNAMATAASNEPHLGAPKKTAVKVRQPPGGASSGLW